MTRLLLLLVAMALSAVTLAAPAAPLKAQDGPPALDQLALDVKIGQMLMAGVDGLSLTDDARHLIADLHVGNVVLMGRNVDAPHQVLQLTRDLQAVAGQANGVGLLVATDQEGGLVQRLRYVDGFTSLPDAVVVGSVRQEELIRAYGRMVGEEMGAVGVNMDLAPVLDVNDNPRNPVIGPRSFGSTPERVVAAGLAFVAGLHNAGVVATGKHFPGHGNTSTDSHSTLPVVNKDRVGLAAVELRPFSEAVGAGIDAIMLAHVVYPALDPAGLPATVSRPIASDLLRGEIGFTGLIVTDDMGMHGITDRYSPEQAAIQSVLAGADLVLCARLDLPQSCKPETLERLRAGLLQAAADGRLPMTRIDESVARILAVKARYAVGPASGEGIDRVGGAAHLRVVGDVLEASGRP